MTHRALGVLLLLGVLAVLLGAPGGAVLAAAGASAPAPPDTVVTPVTDNEFIPANRDLSDCVSALPKPDCGTNARSGWRQWLILGILAAALSFIAWRIVRSTRRQARASRSEEPDDT